VSAVATANTTPQLSPSVPRNESYSSGLASVLTLLHLGGPSLGQPSAQGSGDRTSGVTDMTPVAIATNGDTCGDGPGAVEDDTPLVPFDGDFDVSDDEGLLEL
jgi:hypothetical protein